MSHAELESLVARAEAIAFDPTLPAIRAHKERHGGLAIGYMPIYAPRELFHAQGAVPAALLGGDIEIVRGDAFYQSYICHIPRSVIEMGLDGSLDCLDGVIFPAICDVIRNLSGVWKLSFPDKLSRYLDLPQDFDPELGGRFYREELLALSRDLVARGARPLDPEALAASIALFDQQRRLVDELYGLRRTEPWRLPTAELYVVLRAALVMPPEEANALLGDYLAAARAVERRPLDQARVLLVGSFCEQPPIGLLRTLERAGCYIVDDDLLQAHRFIRGDVARGGEPLDDLVDAILHRAMPSPTRYDDSKTKGQDLVERVREARAEGVLFCAPSFCDPALLDQPLAVRAIEGAGIPWTAFKYAENSGQFQVIREQAGTFADAIKLWSEV